MHKLRSRRTTNTSALIAHRKNKKMPQQVIRDDKTYYEYTPQELEDIRNKQIADRYARNGQCKLAQSPFTQTHGLKYKHNNKLEG